MPTITSAIRSLRRTPTSVLLLAAASSTALAQATGPAAPTEPGQAAYAAIAEVVRILSADSTTDWSRVDIEALRAHLVDMDEVTMRAVTRRREVPGGFSATVTGTGRTVGAIRRMLVAHAGTLEAMAAYRSEASVIPGGVRLTITARDPADRRLVARIRALGVAGMLTEGAHHAMHHLALARGVGMHGH